MRIIIAVSLALFAAPTLAAKYQVPANVTTRTGPYHGDYVDAVDFSSRATQPVEFAKAKLCVAENVTNSVVSLHDTSGSFVGSATGNYYQNSNSQTVQAGNVFKYIDDNAQTLIASGTTDGGATALGLTHDILKFDLKVVTSGTDVTVRFSNITRAQQNTGILANDGFQPVGTWKGSRFQKIYESLEVVAKKINACLR